LPTHSFETSMAPSLSSMTRLTAVISSVLLLSTDKVFGTTTREKALSGTYDYIIVGGGVSGLVVANRLSEKSQSMSSLPNGGPVD
jgi:hypothetical protein